MNTDTFAKLQRPAKAPRSGWVTAYGWYFIARGIIVFLLPFETVFGHSIYTHTFTAIRIGVAFVTGAAVIRRKAFALALVWTDIGLAASYIAFERFATGRFLSRDLLAMAIPILLALWYTKFMWPRVKAGLA